MPAHLKIRPLISLVRVLKNDNDRPFDRLVPSFALKKHSQKSFFLYSRYFKMIVSKMRGLVIYIFTSENMAEENLGILLVLFVFLSASHSFSCLASDASKYSGSQNILEQEDDIQAIL